MSTNDKGMSWATLNELQWVPKFNMDRWINMFEPLLKVFSNAILLSPIFIALAFIIYTSVVGTAESAAAYGLFFSLAMLIRGAAFQSFAVKTNTSSGATTVQTANSRVNCSNLVFVAGGENEGSSAFMNAFSIVYAGFAAQASGIPIVGAGNVLMQTAMWVGGFDAALKAWYECDGLLSIFKNVCFATLLGFCFAYISNWFFGSRAAMFAARRKVAAHSKQSLAVWWN